MKFRVGQKVKVIKIIAEDSEIYNRYKHFIGKVITIKWVRLYDIVHPYASKDGTFREDELQAINEQMLFDFMLEEKE